jgi:hypothetical protein
LTLDESKHLLNRTSFGYTKDDLIKFQNLSKEEAVTLLINANKAIKKYANNIEIKIPFKKTDISNDFKEALKIIKLKIDIPLIKISQKAYDTHAKSNK